MQENTPQPDETAADLNGEPAQGGPAGPDTMETAAAGPDEAAAPAGEPAGEPSEAELLRRERDELRDRWLRAAAELDNYRKRARRELEDVRVLAVAGLLRDLLEVLDNFERAVIAMRESGVLDGDLANWGNGVALIHQRFRDILMAQGLEPIEAEGAEFDPSLHEAILQVEKEGVASGRITEVVQPGYRLRDLVVRPCRVIVAK